MSYRPLADEIRPQSLDEVVGQRHILGENGLLRRIIESGHIPNLVFYGPSGTGKTTVANIIARRTNRPLFTCIMRCSAGLPCLNSSPSRPSTCCPPSTGASGSWGSA